jgi:hypothetical protein
MKKNHQIGRPKKRKYTRRKPVEKIGWTGELVPPNEPSDDVKRKPNGALDYKQMAMELWDLIDDIALFTEAIDENRVQLSPFFRKKFSKRFDYFIRIGGKITATEE